MPRRILSDGQFAEVINQEGGASRHWLTFEEPPKKGYMISAPGHEAIHAGPATEEQVTEHFHENYDSHPVAFAKHPYQGGWVDEHPTTGESPTTFLDVSTRHNVKWHEARELGEKRGQIGVYHLPTGETHYTYRDMPGPQADKAWVSKPKRPSNYERDASAVPEMGLPDPKDTIGRSTGVLNGKQIPLEHVMRTIASGRMEREGQARS